MFAILISLLFGILCCIPDQLSVFYWVSGFKCYVYFSVGFAFPLVVGYLVSPLIKGKNREEIRI